MTCGAEERALGWLDPKRTNIFAVGFSAGEEAFGRVKSEEMNSAAVGLNLKAGAMVAGNVC